MSTGEKIQDADERRLAELGYKQELNRGWSGFQNFAISFTIISILAGCFTTYFQAWNNGGPIAISWGWLLISIPILMIGFCMSELVSAYPTAGGIYWWSSKLGGPAWGWFTGWFNLLGLIAIAASVDYAAAQFSNAILGLYGVDILGVNFGDSANIPGEVFGLFAIILTLHAIVNIAGSHLVAVLNSISVWWHVLGVAVIVVILVLAPSKHASISYVFTHTVNNSGFIDGSTSGLFFALYILPLGGLLTQYTITGFDASAHISEETHGAAESAPKGVWRSIFYSAIIGWVVLLAITFAAWNEKAINTVNDYGVGSSIQVFASSGMGTGAVKAILIIAVLGQLFCGMSCMTSASRMTYAFSRDGAIPGWRIWSKVNAARIPFYAVLFVAVLALIIALPALKYSKTTGGPVAFLAVVSIGVIGLYIAYVIPIFLRWRARDNFTPGPWTNGKKYKWMNLLATLWVALITIVFCLPVTPGGVPFDKDWNWSLVNYAPIVTGGVFLIVGIWWLVSARHTFTGPRRTIEEIDQEVVAGAQAALRAIGAEAGDLSPDRRPPVTAGAGDPRARDGSHDRQRPRHRLRSRLAADGVRGDRRPARDGHPRRPARPRVAAAARTRAGRPAGDLPLDAAPRDHRARAERAAAVGARSRRRDLRHRGAAARRRPGGGARRRCPRGARRAAGHRGRRDAAGGRARRAR